MYENEYENAYGNEMVTMQYRSFDSIEATETKWLWYPYLPKGKIVLLSAKPGTGKTFFALWLCAVLSRGASFWGQPDKRHFPEAVVYQTAEDGVADTLKKRLTKINPFPDYKLIYNVDESDRSLSLTEPEGIEKILQKLRPALMIFDPLQAYMGAEVDMHRANHVRPVMARIAHLAEQYNCTMLFIMHHSKMQQGNALYGVLGSVDIPAVSRSMLMLDKNPENENELILAHVKSSLAKNGQSIIFHLDDGNLVFDGYSDLTADELYQKIRNRRSSGSLDKATELLQAAVDANGWVCVEDVREMAKKNGISFKTFQRAMNALHLEHIRVGFQNQQGFWIAPDADREMIMQQFSSDLSTEDK